MDRKQIYIVIAVLVFIGLSINLDAQCAMCSMAAEQNLKDGGTDGKGLNKGIFLLLALPYVLVSFIGYQWYKSQKTQKEVSEDILS